MIQYLNFCRLSLRFFIKLRTFLASKSQGPRGQLPPCPPPPNFCYFLKLLYPKVKSTCLEYYELCRNLSILGRSVQEPIHFRADLFRNLSSCIFSIYICIHRTNHKTVKSMLLREAAKKKFLH